MHDRLNKFFKNIFTPTPENFPQKCFHIGGLLILFSVGFAYWCWFFNLGKLTFVAHDWPRFYKYHSVLKQALTDNVIPYYVSTDFQGTDRFMAVPEFVLSPQIFLLKYLSIGPFILVHVLILYSLGFVGCLLIKKQFELSLFTFSILFIIFNFNGHIVSHLSVGHCSWGGYFLLPFFIGWLFKLADGEDSKRQIGKLAFILFAILLQGSLHIFVWCLMLLGLLCIQGKRLRRPVMMIVLLSFFLASCRLIPATITFYDKSHGFISGFPSIAIMIESLVQMRDHTYFIPLGKAVGTEVGWWEFSHYISVMGFATIAYFGIYQRVKSFSSPDPHLFRRFDLPMIVFAVFSLSYMFGPIANLPVPLINVERNSSRFFIMPLLILTVIACARLQQTLNKHKITSTTGLLALAGLLHGSFSLGAHSLNWQLINLEGYFKGNIVDLRASLAPLSQKSEGLYLLSVQSSFIITLLALAALVYLFLPSRKPSNS